MPAPFSPLDALQTLTGLLFVAAIREVIQFDDTPAQEAIERTDDSFEGHVQKQKRRYRDLSKEGERSAKATEQAFQRALARTTREQQKAAAEAERANKKASAAAEREAKKAAGAAERAARKAAAAAEREAKKAAAAAEREAKKQTAALEREAAKQELAQKQGLDRVKGLWNLATGFILAKIAQWGVQGGAAIFRLGTGVEETLSKFKDTFGGSTAEVERWIQANASLMGMSRSQARDALATVASAVIGLGAARKEAAGFSQEFLRVAASLQSFDNAPIEEVVASLRSGLNGEIEPMRRFGVELDANSVKMKAAAMGAKEVNGAYGAWELQQARLALVMDRVQLKMDNHITTKDSLANRTRFLAAEMHTLAEDMSVGLMPAYDVVVRLGRQLVDNWKEQGGTLRAQLGGAVLDVAERTYALGGSMVGTYQAGTQLLGIFLDLEKSGGLLGWIADRTTATFNNLTMVLGALTAGWYRMAQGVAATSEALYRLPLVGNDELADRDAETFRRYGQEAEKAWDRVKAIWNGDEDAKRKAFFGNIRADWEKLFKDLSDISSQDPPLSLLGGVTGPGGVSGAPDQARKELAAREKFEQSMQRLQQARQALTEREASLLSEIAEAEERLAEAREKKADPALIAQEERYLRTLRAQYDFAHEAGNLIRSNGIVRVAPPRARLDSGVTHDRKFYGTTLTEALTEEVGAEMTKQVERLAKWNKEAKEAGDKSKTWAEGLDAVADSLRTMGRVSSQLGLISEELEEMIAATADVLDNFRNLSEFRATIGTAGGPATGSMAAIAGQILPALGIASGVLGVVTTIHGALTAGQREAAAQRRQRIEEAREQARETQQAMRETASAMRDALDEFTGREYTDAERRASVDEYLRTRGGYNANDPSMVDQLTAEIEQLRNELLYESDPRRAAEIARTIQNLVEERAREQAKLISPYQVRDEFVEMIEELKKSVPGFEALGAEALERLQALMAGGMTPIEAIDRILTDGLGAIVDRIFAEGNYERPGAPGAEAPTGPTVEALLAALTRRERLEGVGGRELYNSFLGDIAGVKDLLPAEFYEHLAAAWNWDPSTQEGQDRLKLFIQEMAAAFKGDADVDQILEALKQFSEGAIPGTGLGSADSTGVSRSMTEVQAVAVTAWLEQIAFWTKETAALLRQQLGSTPGQGRTPGRGIPVGPGLYAGIPELQAAKSVAAGIAGRQDAAADVATRMYSSQAFGTGSGGVLVQIGDVTVGAGMSQQQYDREASRIGLAIEREIKARYPGARRIN